MHACRLTPFFLLMAAGAAGSPTPTPTPPAQSAPASAAARPDLSTPKAAILSLYAALRAGDVPRAQSCMDFTDPQQAENFAISATQLWTPLKLMHAMEARFGKSGRKPFACASLEQSVDKAVEDLNRAQINESGDTAIVTEKKAATDPAAETEVTGITLRHSGGKWRVVASSFPDATAEIPAGQMAMMRARSAAIVAAGAAILDRLTKGEFKSAEQAFAAYQVAQQAHPAASSEPTPAR